MVEDVRVSSPTAESYTGAELNCLGRLSVDAR